jgi:D-arabinose 1-dehydrogenase-like Zn-dependent alcohol dehydrogenase
MRAAVMHGYQQPLVVENVADPKLQPSGAIVRVEANGICRSDWHGWQGDWKWLGVKFQFPHVLGHEFSGVVEAVSPEVRSFKPGDRVIVPFSQGDGTCEHCLSGNSNVCENAVTPGFAYWGGFGQYAHIPNAERNLIAMPSAMDFVQGAALGCRYMSAFHGIVNRAHVRPGEFVVVVGCGGIGLSAIQIANAIGARVIAIDIDDNKLDKARAIGAEYVVSAKTEDKPFKAVRSITQGGAHVSVDALGITDTCLTAIRSLRSRGRHLQLGLTGADDQGAISLPIDLMVMKQIDLVTSYGLPATGYGPMLAMVAAGKLAPASLVSNTVPLDDTGKVLADMSRFDTLGFTVFDRY